ncbi:uncharacterized protein METZ01_LOCUS515855, partial [marine metagenome]
GIGFQALTLQTAANQNVAIGYTAGAALTDGEQNTFVGSNAASSGTITGDKNVAMGYQAGNSLTSGEQNVALGASALSNIAGGDDNVGIGYQAGVNCTGDANVFVGREAGRTSASANSQTCVGWRAGYSVTGAGNTLIGYHAGTDTIALTTGTYNVCIGQNTRTSANNAEKQIVIGYDFAGNGDNKINMGSSSGYVWNSYTVNNTWTQVSDRRLKKNIEIDTLGLEFIN